jgi:tetratricopeptide (TPR) repeat protein
LKQKSIDPKIKYSEFYVNDRHTAAGTSSRRGIDLYKFAEMADDPLHIEERVWVDVLLVPQYAASPSDQIRATEEIFRDCKVWVVLDDSYPTCAWSLAEAAQFGNVSSKCPIFVSGSARLQRGGDFYSIMDAGQKAEVPVVQQYVVEKHGSKEIFNLKVDDAIVRLSAQSLINGGSFFEVFEAYEQEIALYNTAAGDTSELVTVAQANLALCYENLQDWKKSLEIHQQVSEALERRHGSEHVSVVLAGEHIGIAHQQLGDYESALSRYKKAAEVKTRRCGAESVSVADTKANMAAAYYRIKNEAKGAQLYREAHATYLQALGPDHHKTTTVARFI